MQIEKHMMEQQIQETTSDLIEVERELSMSQSNSPAPSTASRNSTRRDLDDAVVIEKLRREHDWMMQVRIAQNCHDILDFAPIRMVAYASGMSLSLNRDRSGEPLW